MPGGAQHASRPASAARCTGVILAGGASSRFGGSPKGLARVGGERVIDRVARALRDASDELLLAANDPRAAEWLPGVPVVRDEVAGRGPLAGIQAALRLAGTSVLVVAWDMPFVSAGLLRELREAGSRSGHAAVLPEGPQGFPEPLCAWYDRAALPAIDMLLARDERRMSSLVAALRAELVPVDEVARHGDPARLFANLNTPDDVALAEALQQGGAR